MDQIKAMKKVGLFQNKGRSHSTGRWLIRAILTFLSVAVTSLIVLSWWLTAPLEKVQDESSSESTIPEALVKPLPVWPAESIEGLPAKQRLRDILLIVVSRLESISGYTATLKKQERIDGKLLAEQTLAIKIRNQPFAFYAKFLDPKPGKEVVYSDGHNQNQVIAHNGDWTRRLVPRLAVSPDSKLALNDSRHPVTEAGLVYLTRKLLNFRTIDMSDPEAGSTLDWAEGPDGRPWPRSIHTHPHPTPKRPFARIEVLYDPDSLIPRQIINYDWPAHGVESGGELPLAERYLYLDLNFDVNLTDHDFDPANPDYAFHRL